jgi:hypothetical protein
MTRRTGSGHGDVERELKERSTEERRQRSGAMPTEDVLEKALEIEPGVERHAGEDPGGVPPDEGQDR